MSELVQQVRVTVECLGGSAGLELTQLRVLAPDEDHRAIALLKRGPEQVRQMTRRLQTNHSR